MSVPGFVDMHRLIQECHPEVEIHFWTDQAHGRFVATCAECNKVLADVAPTTIQWTVTGGEKQP